MAASSSYYRLDVTEAGLKRAIMVSARYSDGRKGLVYGYIPPDFAADLLKDVRWSWMAKLKHVVVKSVNGLTQPFR
jgi:hypothetical protein